jgi:protein-L-isoaspartate O-methyltransferase
LCKAKPHRIREPPHPAWAKAAEALADKVTADAPEWRDTVANTPRHLLVPNWWQPVPDGPEREWARVSHSSDGDAGFSGAAYANKTLVTRVGSLHADQASDGDRATGDPTSSGTVPALIVDMAHRLDARTGHRILDVGTGTGYSAALFARRFGSAHVTSVDVDPYVVDAARDRLSSLGLMPQFVALDATGELPDAAYDRIVATVSVRPVPAPWLRALQPGGRVVTTVAHTALMITADMWPDGTARGSVVPDPATFMAARRENDYPPALDDVFLTSRTREGEDVRPPVGPVPDLWEEWPLRCLYELDTPVIEIRTARYEDGRRVVWLLGRDGSWARAETGDRPLVHQGGPRRLWDGLERVRSEWNRRNRFPLRTMTAELSERKSALTAPDGTWVIRL